jgi:hypothetical protein
LQVFAIHLGAWFAGEHNNVSRGTLLHEATEGERANEECAEKEQ